MGNCCSRKVETQAKPPTQIQSKPISNSQATVKSQETNNQKPQENNNPKPQETNKPKPQETNKAQAQVQPSQAQTTPASSAKPKIEIAKLYYFNIYARGESIRLLLNHAKIPFEDVRIEMSQWPSIKAQMPGGQVPVIELKSGQKMNQTNSVLRLLGKLLGYYPSDTRSGYEVDYLIDNFMDIFPNIPKPVFVPQEAKEKATTTALDSVDSYLTKLDPVCKKGGFLVGDKLTIADFVIGGLYTNCFINPQVYAKEKWDQILLKHPDFKGYGERFLAANAEYIKKRPQAPI